jgi:hypothetical protein
MFLNCFTSLGGLIPSPSVPFTPSTDYFQNTINEKDPFYNQHDYIDLTRKDFGTVDHLPTTYTWNTEHKIVRIAKAI